MRWLTALSRPRNEVRVSPAIGESGNGSAGTGRALSAEAIGAYPLNLAIWQSGQGWGRIPWRSSAR